MTSPSRSARSSRGSRASASPRMGDSEEDLKRKERQQRAKDAEEEERSLLASHLREVDQRLLQNSLRKEADRLKRNADAWDPTPKVRPMYGDVDIARSAKIPGPGAHSPRFAAIESFGTKFSRSHFDKSQHYDRDQLFGRAGETKGAADTPGPASYQSLDSPRGNVTHHSKKGKTFGLPKELVGDAPVPDAHDMSRMVRHLKDLPAPDAYSPRNPAEKNKAFYMRPSNALSPLEVEMLECGTKPGPGAYDPLLPAGRTTNIGGTGALVSEIDKIVKQSAEVPGPGRYRDFTQLRGTGAPKFGKGETKSFIEQVMADSVKKPGPGGSLFVQPTFKEEQMRRKHLVAMAYGS